MKHSSGSVVRRKYFMVLAALIASFLIVQSSLEMVFAFRENKLRIADVQQASAMSASARIESYLESIERQVRDVSQLPWSSELLDENDRREEFHRLLKLVPAIFEIRHYGRDRVPGTYASRIVPDHVAPESKPPGDELLKAARERGSAFGPTYFRDRVEPFVSVAVAERAGTGGVTVADINLKFVADVVAGLRIGEAGEAFVVDGAGNLVAHRDLSLVLRKADLSTYPPIAALRSAAGDAGAAANASRIPSSIGMFEAESANGGIVLASGVPIPATGWRVFVEQPYSEALRPVFDTLFRTIAFLALALVASAIASLFLARKLTGPILDLRQGASRIGTGDLDARIDVRTGDEIQALADEFNDMAGKLKESYDGLELKVQQKTAQLELANRHKSEFLANMSHELRTPLNAVIGFSDVLRDQYFGALNDRQSQYVRDINESGQHLLSLINDILDLSKVEAGRMELELSRFNLPAAIDNALVLVRERALRQGVELRSAIAPEVGDIVADERKVKQILINLLTNAVKFSHAGGWVEVGAIDGTYETVISVRDTGVGIAHEDQQAIFEEFRQLKSSGRAKHEGTGLGLALVKRFVELNGGTIRVESEPGSGASFIFTLPHRELPVAAAP